MFSSSTSDEIIVNVQKWFARLYVKNYNSLMTHCYHRMNCITLDTVGIAGFGHDFGALHGQHSAVEEAFDSFGSGTSNNMIVFLLGVFIPLLEKVPTKRRRLVKKLHSTMEEISDQLLQRSRKEKELCADATDTSRSIIGSLRKSVLVYSLVHAVTVAPVRAEDANSEWRLTPDETLAQVIYSVLRCEPSAHVILDESLDFSGL